MPAPPRGPLPRGPLRGIRFVEFAGIGPVPLAATVLADLGADGIRIEAPGRTPIPDGPAPDRRGRAAVRLDLRHPDGAATALRLVERADVLLEGFRPGVMERRGVGPDRCLGCNPRLVYGRMTGWGQTGPLARTAGHDINYLAVAGPLAHVGRRGQPPVPPLNLVGDYGGGAMLLVAGVLAALLETARSGQGQVVDAAMVDGASLLMTPLYGFLNAGMWNLERGTNLLDGAAPFYDTYQTSDGRYVAVGALEPRFYAELLEGLGLTGEGLPAQDDRDGWPRLRARFTEVFATRTRDEWAAVFAGTDACVTPVMDMREAADHPHIRARGTLVSVDGVLQPAPAPRFSRTPAAVPPAAVSAAARTASGPDALERWGVPTAEVARLRAAGVVD